MDYYQQDMPFRRIPRAEVYQAIQMYCCQQTGTPVSIMEKIEEFPDKLRHSCLNTGVVELEQYNWKVPSDYGEIGVPFYFCPVCGKLFVSNNIYD